MSSQYISESRSFHEESSRRASDGYNLPLNSRITVPVHHSSTSFITDGNQERIQDRIRRPDTTVQWVQDSVSGREKFRVNINIEGFSQHEVRAHVEGNKLIVYGEHIEKKHQSETKKIIEKSLDLPKDVDKHQLRVLFPTSTLMQIDFPSCHSNVIIDDGRVSSRLVTNYDTSPRPLSRFTQERSTNEFSSTRKLGAIDCGGGHERSSTPRTYTYYDSLLNDNRTSRNAPYSTTIQRQCHERQSSSERGFTHTTADTCGTSSKGLRVNFDDCPVRTIEPLSIRNDADNGYQRTFTEMHRETHHRRSSPTTGVQSTHEVEHRRSGSPCATRTIDEDRFRTGCTLNSNNNILQPSTTSRNVEVREFTRRIGNGGAGDNDERTIFSKGFNSDAFYRSAFRPQVFKDNFGNNRIEMILDVRNYQPNEIKISVKNNDLIVEARHNEARPPTSSTSAYFYKQITLPPNTDLNSVSSQFTPEGQLHITAKLANPQSSIRYN